MYDLGCMLLELRPFVVLDGLPSLYGLKYDSATACGPQLYLCSYKLVGSATRHILNAAFPPRYRPPTNIPKYSRETNPRLWLEDYQIAYQASGADNDNFIIRNLPLFLANSARAWLEHLPSNAIQSWADLKEIFVGNF